MYTIINYSILVISMLLVFYVFLLGILRFFKYDTLADRFSTTEEGIIVIRTFIFLVSIVTLIVDFVEGIPSNTLSNTAVTYIILLSILSVMFIGASVVMFLAELRRKMPQR